MKSGVPVRPGVGVWVAVGTGVRVAVGVGVGVGVLEGVAEGVPVGAGVPAGCGADTLGVGVTCTAGGSAAAPKNVLLHVQSPIATIAVRTGKSIFQRSMLSLALDA